MECTAIIDAQATVQVMRRRLVTDLRDRLIRLDVLLGYGAADGCAEVAGQLATDLRRCAEDLVQAVDAAVAALPAERAPSVSVVGFDPIAAGLRAIAEERRREDRRVSDRRAAAAVPAVRVTQQPVRPRRARTARAAVGSRVRGGGAAQRRRAGRRARLTARASSQLVA